MTLATIAHWALLLRALAAVDILPLMDGRTLPWDPKAVRQLSETHIPRSFRQKLFEDLIRQGGVNRDDIAQPLVEFDTIQAFFTRPVKPRAIDRDPRLLLSPADALLTEVARVGADSALEVKRVSYSLRRLLSNVDGRVPRDELDRLRGGARNVLFALTFYLSPRDYHRFHSPARMWVDSLSHIAGLRLTVRPDAVRNTTVLDNNERVVLRGRSALGPATMVFVSATGVGGIRILGFDSARLARVSFAPPAELAAGQEVGMFLLGSTIVLVVGVPPEFRWRVAAGESVRYGQVLGEVPSEVAEAKSSK